MMFEVSWLRATQLLMCKLISTTSVRRTFIITFGLWRTRAVPACPNSVIEYDMNEGFLNRTTLTRLVTNSSPGNRMFVLIFSSFSDCGFSSHLLFFNYWYSVPCSRSFSIILFYYETTAKFMTMPRWKCAYYRDPHFFTSLFTNLGRVTIFRRQNHFHQSRPPK